MFNWNGGQPRYGFPQQQQQQMVPGLVPQGQFHFQQTMQQPMRWVPPQSAAPVGVGMMVGQAWSAANPSMLPMATTAPVGMPSLPGMSQGMMLNASRPQMPPLPDRPPLPAGPPLPEGPPPPLPDFPQDVRPPLPESPQAPPPEEPQPSEPDPTVLADLEKLKKEEDMFLDQYKNWKNQYDDWRQQNESHPNKEQFEQYLEQWKTYEKQMEARRKSIESQRQILEEKLAMSILSQPSAKGPPTSVSEPINVRPPVDSQSRNISGAGSSLGGRREDKGEQDMNLDDEDMNLDDEEESACGGIIVESAGQQSSNFGWDSSQTESKDKEVEDDNTKSGNLAEPGNTEQSDKQCEEPIKSQTETSQSFPGNFEGVGDGISQSNESEWEGEYHMSGMEGRGGFGMRGRGRGAQRGREESGRGRGRFGSDSNSMPYGGRRDDFEGDATGYENDWNQYGNEGFGNEDEGSMDGSNSGAGFGFDSSYRGGRGGFGRGRGGFESSMRGGGRGGFESSMRGGGRGGFEGGRGGFEGARGGFEGGRGGFEGGRGGFKGGRGGRDGFEGGSGGFEGGRGGFEGGRGGFEGGRGGFEGGRGGFEGGRGGFEGGRGGFEGGRGGFEGGRGGFEGGRGGFDRGRGGFESNIRGRGGRGGFEGGRGGFGRGGGGFEGREDGLESEFEEATDEFEGGGDGFEGGRGGMGRGRGGFESGRGGRGGFRGGFDGGRGGYEGGRGGFEGGRGRGGFEGGRGGFEGGRGRGGMGRARGGFEGGRGGFEGGRGGFDGGRGGFGKGRGGFEGGRGGFEGGRGGLEGGRGGFEGGRGGFGGGFEGGRGGFEGGRGGRGGFGGGFEGGRGAFGRGRGGFEGGRGAFGNARGGRGGGFDFGRGGYEGSRGRGRGGRGGFRGNDYGYSYGEQEAESYGYEETEYQEGGEYGNESSGWEGHGGEYGGNEEEYYEGNEDGSNYNGNNRFGRGGQFRQGFGRGQSQEGDDRNYESSEGNSGFGRGRGAGFRGRGRGMSKFSAMGDQASATEADADISTNYHDRGDRSNTDMSRSGEEDYEEGNWPTGDNSENTYTPRGGFQQRGLPRGRGGRGRGVGMGRGNGRVGNDFSDFSKSEAVEEGNNKQEGDEDSAAGKDSHFPSETGSFGSESSRGRGGAAGNRGRGRGNGARERNFSQDDEPPRKMGRLDPLDPMYDDRLGLYPDFDPYRRLPRDPYFRDPYLDPLDAFLPPPLPLYDYDRGYDYPPRFEPLPERRPAVAVESIDYGHGSSDQDKKAAAPAEVIEYGHGQTSKEEAKEKKADSIDDAKDFGDKDLRHERMNELSAQTARTYSSQDTIYDRYDKDREDLWQRQRLPQSHETDDYSRDWRKDDEEATSSIKLQDERSRFRDSQWDSGDMNRLKDKDERRSNENFTDRAAELYKRKEEEEVESLRFDDQYRSKDRWADRDRDDREQGDREMFDRERGDRARIVDREKGERDRFDRERSDRDRFDRERGDRDRIDRERSDRDRADRERGDRDRIDRERRSDREYRPSDYSESELERSIRGRERYEDRDRDRPERVDRRQTEEEGLNEYRGESRREKRAFGIGDEWLKEGKGRGVSDRTQSRYDNENSSRSSYSDRHVDNKDRSYRDKEYSYQGGERSFSRLDRVDYHKDSSAQFNDNDDVHGRQFGRERIGETSRRSDWREDDRHMKGVRDLPNTVPSPDRHVTPPTRGPSRGSAVTQLTTFETMKVEDILCSPQREKRPPQIVVIIRGLPGSGKTYISKLLREKEASYGGQAPRILCLDDYFMVEEEKEEKDPETGKRVKRKVLEYEYEQELEEAYRQSMLKSFKKTVDDGFFPFIIVDATNEKVVNFSEFWSYAKSRGFQVYVAEMVADISLCIQRNVHRWTEWDIEKVKRNWERLPNHYIKLDIRWLLQEDAIQEVEMEDTVNEKEEDNEDDDDEFSEGVYTRSKWEFDTSDKTLDKLDGIPVSKKHIIEHQSMDDYLQLDQDETDDDYFSRESLPGQKRVRWADLEEKKTQSRRRDLGFIVGQTQRDWDRITDDDFAEKALNQTKYFYK